jgi:hypothetical protein
MVPQEVNEEEEVEHSRVVSQVRGVSAILFAIWKIEHLRRVS